MSHTQFCGTCIRIWIFLESKDYRAIMLLLIAMGLGQFNKTGPKVSRCNKSHRNIGAAEFTANEWLSDVFMMTLIMGNPYIPNIKRYAKSKP